MRRILVIILLLVASCGNDDRKGPVDIHYGQDICERCKMIISEEKFSSQVIMDNGEVYNFDDIGGMIRYMSDNGISSGEIKIYVKDFNTGKWLGSEEAVYVVTDGINTPMMFGVIAVSDKESANRMVAEHGGRVFERLAYVMEFIVNKK